MQHLQAFVAGDLVLSGLSEQSSSFPLLFFCWPGGICDVYSAHLLPSPAQDTEALVALVENGTAEDLRRLLQSLTSDPDNLLANSRWAQARDEILALTGKDSGVTLEDLQSSKLAHFRKLLLQLANPSIQDPLVSNISG